MKTWKTKAICSYYEDASQIKSLLLENDDSGLLEVKIRRCGPGGSKFKIKHITQSPPRRKLKMKKKQTQKQKTHVITNEPDDITLELAKTMAEIKEDYDLPTEEVAKTVSTNNNNRFRNIFKKLLDS